MADIRLSMGFNDYDHVRDLFTGRVKPEGIELTCLQMRVEEIFHRFSANLEWDVSEVSFAFACSMMARGDAPFVAIPVFPSRVFRHSSIYVRTDGPVTAPGDLAGARIGVPQWAQTATVFVRGWMTDTLDIPMSAVQWFQSGVEHPGRVDPARVRLPDGVERHVVTDRSLMQMMDAGELDAIITAQPPIAFDQGDPKIRRLFPDYRAVEEAYFDETGIFPIMHVVAIRREQYEKNPWIARNLFNAFNEAKERSVFRINSIGQSRIAVPWLPETVDRVGGRVFGDGDYWPYGIEQNRTTIEAFLKYCFDQGVTSRHLAAEEVFAPESLTQFKI